MRLVEVVLMVVVLLWLRWLLQLLLLLLLLRRYWNGTRPALDGRRLWVIGAHCFGCLSRLSLDLVRLGNRVGCHGGLRTCCCGPRWLRW